MKSKLVAALLAFFLGGFGAHKFYIGKIGQGILYLIFSWTGIPAIIAFIEFILYLVVSDEEFNRKYCGIVVNTTTTPVNTDNNNNNSNIL